MAPNKNNNNKKDNQSLTKTIEALRAEECCTDSEHFWGWPPITKKSTISKAKEEPTKIYETLKSSNEALAALNFLWKNSVSLFLSWHTK